MNARSIRTAGLSEPRKVDADADAVDTAPTPKVRKPEPSPKINYVLGIDQFVIDLGKGSCQTSSFFRNLRAQQQRANPYRDVSV